MSVCIGRRCPRGAQLTQLRGPLHDQARRPSRHRQHAERAAFRIAGDGRDDARTVCFLIHCGSRHPGKHLRLWSGVHPIVDLRLCIQAHDFTVMFLIVLVRSSRERDDDFCRRETLRHGVHATVSSKPRSKVFTPHLRAVQLHPAGVRIRHADEDVSDDSGHGARVHLTGQHRLPRLGGNFVGHLHRAQRFLAAAVDGHQNVLIHHEGSRVHLATAAELVAPQNVSIYTECLEPALIQARVHGEKQQTQARLHRADWRENEARVPDP
mmetsp:Transcript_9776/g.27275  ORF Transcript_9776/g.27275 Transcript_9776/m.27275 type:complete len:267 (+) Transcript_9776:616-1416(+)